VVIEPLNPWTCTGCGGSGSLLFMEGVGPLCMGWADLDHLVFLPAGDAALSRRARRASGLAAVVVRFSRSRRRYERRGIPVEEGALEQAEAQCLADAEARARRRERDRQRRADQDVAFEARLAEAVGRLFPGCPAGRAEAIAQHAAVRGSGRARAGRTRGHARRDRLGAPPRSRAASRRDFHRRRPPDVGYVTGSSVEAAGASDASTTAAGPRRSHSARTPAANPPRTAAANQPGPEKVVHPRAASSE
jgi:hypothetical protein